MNSYLVPYKYKLISTSHLLVFFKNLIFSIFIILFLRLLSLFWISFVWPDNLLIVFSHTVIALLRLLNSFFINLMSIWMGILHVHNCILYNSSYQSNISCFFGEVFSCTLGLHTKEHHASSNVWTCSSHSIIGNDLNGSIHR